MRDTEEVCKKEIGAATGRRRRVVEQMLSVESEFFAYGIDFRGSHETSVRDLHNDWLAVEPFPPRVKKREQLGELRAEIVLLPKVPMRVDEPRRIWLRVPDLRCRESVAAELSFEITGDSGCHYRLPHYGLSCPPRTSKAVRGNWSMCAYAHGKKVKSYTYSIPTLIHMVIHPLSTRNPLKSSIASKTRVACILYTLTYRCALPCVGRPEAKGGNISSRRTVPWVSPCAS